MDLDELLAVSSGQSRFDWSKLCAGLICLASIYMIYLFMASPRFRVHHVAVHGTRLLDESQVVAAAEVQGKSLFTVRTDQVAERLEGQFPGLARVSAACSLPNRVVITVREEEALLAWHSGSLYWWIDARGRVLGSDDEPGDLLTIHDVAGIEPQPHEMIVGVPWKLALDLKRALPPLAGLEYTREMGLSAYVGLEKWPVYFGHEGNAAAKVAVLQALIARLSQQGTAVEYIDLRDETAPTFKRR